MKDCPASSARNRGRPHPHTVFQSSKLAPHFGGYLLIQDLLQVHGSGGTNPKNEQDGIHQALGRAASPAATTPIPLPRASLSF